MEDLFDDGRSLRLQFPAEDLGFVYASQFEKRKPLPPRTLSKSKNRSHTFVQRLVPGGRLPHFIVRPAESERLVSSLDLVACTKLNCTVFMVGIDRDECPALLASNASEFLLQDLTVVLLRHNEGPETPQLKDHIPFVPATQSEEKHGVFMVEAVELERLLTKRYEEGGEPYAIVVRPDAHVSSILTQPTAKSLSNSIRVAFLSL